MQFATNLFKRHAFVMALSLKDPEWIVDLKKDFSSLVTRGVCVVGCESLI